MKNKILIIIVIIVVMLILISVFLFTQNQTTEKLTTFDPLNSTYIIENQTFTLSNGKSKVGNIETKYFGNSATADLNNDGLADTAFLITQNTGGSGLFYYAVVALKTEFGYKMTNAFLVGDRISPQSTEIKNLELHINFAERNKGEPMTTPPSVGAVLLLKVTPQGVLEGLMK
jgi:hypothetical protein